MRERGAVMRRIRTSPRIASGSYPNGDEVSHLYDILNYLHYFLSKSFGKVVPKFQLLRFLLLEQLLRYNSIFRIISNASAPDSMPPSTLSDLIAPAGDQVYVVSFITFNGVVSYPAGGRTDTILHRVPFSLYCCHKPEIVSALLLLFPQLAVREKHDLICHNVTL